MEHSLPGSSVRGILWARILEWVAISFSSDLPDPGIEPVSLVFPALAGGFFNHHTTWERGDLWCWSRGQQITDLGQILSLPPFINFYQHPAMPVKWTGLHSCCNRRGE